MAHRSTLGILFVAIAAALPLPWPAAEAQTPPAGSPPTRANPASKNCIDKGGRLVMEKSGSGGEFGVCLFTDNLQCEEWAMLRGECRTGGVKVTGYATPAARYCAITGGTYKVTAKSNTPGERGTCTFPNRNTCDAQAYFDGTCTREAKAAGAAPALPAEVHAVFRCNGGRSIDATFVNGKESSVRLALSDGRRLTLPQAMSGSGARYANRDESLVFWNKGNTAFLEEKGQATYDGCATGG